MDDSRYAFLVVLDGGYWNRLTQQATQIKYFVRRAAVGPIQTQRLLFYVGKRTQVLGAADFVQRTVGDADALWEQFGAESFFESKEQYKTFCGANRKMTFIQFENFKQIAQPQPKNEVVRALGSVVWLQPKYVSRENAALLENNL